MAYIEYRIDNFGLQKHLPESKKKPIHRIFPAIHFDPGKKKSQVLLDCCSRL